MTRFLKPVLFACGTLCLGLGVLGVVLPGLPTTPFLLLAAACYARSSQRFYDWMLSNRVFGASLRDYRDGRGVAPRHKAAALVVMWTGVLATAAFLIEPWWGRLLLAAIAAAVTVYLVRLPTRRG